MAKMRATVIVEWEESDVADVAVNMTLEDYVIHDIVNNGQGTYTVVKLEVDGVEMQ